MANKHRINEIAMSALRKKIKPSRTEGEQEGGMPFYTGSLREASPLTWPLSRDLKEVTDERISGGRKKNAPDKGKELVQKPRVKGIVGKVLGTAGRQCV